MLYLDIVHLILCLYLPGFGWTVEFPCLCLPVWSEEVEGHVPEPLFELSAARPNHLPFLEPGGGRRVGDDERFYSFYLCQP